MPAPPSVPVASKKKLFVEQASPVVAAKALKNDAELVGGPGPGHGHGPDPSRLYSVISLIASPNPHSGGDARGPLEGRSGPVRLLCLPRGHNRRWGEAHGGPGEGVLCWL